MTVSDWAKKFAEMYPDELAKAEHISLNRLFDELTTVALVQFDAKTNFKLRADKGDTKRGLEILNKLSSKDG